jgi:hypothetical protein
MAAIKQVTRSGVKDHSDPDTNPKHRELYSNKHSYSFAPIYFIEFRSML